jgi:hypothetical protein
MQQACLRHNATHRLPNGSGSWEGGLAKDWCGGHNWPLFPFLHNGGGRVSRACFLRYSAEERRHARYQAARLPPFDEGPRGRRSLGPGRIFTKGRRPVPKTDTDRAPDLSSKGSMGPSRRPRIARSPAVGEETRFIGDFPDIAGRGPVHGKAAEK